MITEQGVTELREKNKRLETEIVFPICCTQLYIGSRILHCCCESRIGGNSIEIEIILILIERCENVII